MALADLSFKLWADEAMTTEAGTVLNGQKKQDIDFNAVGEVKNLLFYFGSKTAGRKLQTVAAPGVADIAITPTDILPNRQNNTAYALNMLLEPATDNGFVYRVIAAGTSASAEPAYPQGVGSEVLDGSVRLQNIGRKHEVGSIRLALSAAGLNTATAGAALPLGKTLNSGAALALHVRVTNAVADFYNATGYPMLALEINEVRETEV